MLCNVGIINKATMIVKNGDSPISLMHVVEFDDVRNEYIKYKIFMHREQRIFDMQDYKSLKSANVEVAYKELIDMQEHKGLKFSYLRFNDTEEYTDVTLGGDLSGI